MQEDEDVAEGKSKTPASVSASILALASLVSKKKEEADVRKSASSGGPVFITSTRTFKKAKPTVQNKGVETRAARDEAAYEKEDIYNRPDVAEERVYLQLKRKAELYELRKKLGTDFEDEDGVEASTDAELVDFLQKKHDELDGEQLQSGPSQVIKTFEESDWVEFIDEFNRKRLVRKSQLPSMGLKFVKGTGVVDSLYTGPELVSKDMLREQERQEWEDEAKAQSQYLPTNSQSHFDYKRENRQMGVGFYAFSQDEAERRKQQEQLSQLRNNTLMAKRLALAMKSAKEKRTHDRRRMIAERAIRRKRLREDGILPSSYNSNYREVSEDEGDALDLVRMVRSKFD